jgi:hypothetical protein
MDLLTRENKDVTLYLNVGSRVPKDPMPDLDKLESPSRRCEKFLFFRNW